MTLNEQMDLLMNNLMDEFSLLSLKYSKYRDIIVITSDLNSWPGILASYLAGEFSDIRLETIHLSRLLYYYPKHLSKDKLVIFALDNYFQLGPLINSMLKGGIEIIALLPYKDNEIEGIDPKYHSKNFRTIFGLRSRDKEIGYEDYILSAMLNLFVIYLFKERNIPVEFLLKIQVNMLPNTIKELLNNSAVKELSKINFDSIVCDPLRYFLLKNSKYERLFKIYSYTDKFEGKPIVIKPRSTYVSKKVYSLYSSVSKNHAVLDPFSFVKVTGTGSKNDILLSPLYLLLLDLVLKYKSSP